MKKSLKIVILSLLLIVLIPIMIFCLMKNFILGVMFGIIVLVLISILLFILFKSNDDKYLYKKELERILETYNSILVKSSTLPRLDEKNIIIVESIEDLIKAHETLRKPIYYKPELSCCVFSLLDSNEACIYILKVDDGVKSDLESIMKEIEERKKRKYRDYSIFDEIDKTMIIKLENSKEFKVSPVNKMHVTDEMKEDSLEVSSEVVEDATNINDNRVAEDEII